MTCQSLINYIPLKKGFPKFVPMKTQIPVALGRVSGFVLLCGHLQEGVVTPSHQHPTFQIQNYELTHLCSPQFVDGW